VSGIVEEVGPEQSHVRKEERIAALACPKLGPEYGAFQQKTIVYDYLALKVPDTIKLEAAATVPSAYACAGLALFHHLELELPDRRESSKNVRVSDEPILVYGGSSNVGQFAIQLLKLSGYLNIITVASSVHHDYLKSLGARYAVDYQVPDAPGDKTAPIVAGRILQFAGGTKPKRIIDAVSSKESQQVVTAMLGDEPGKVALTMPKATGWSGNVQVFETCTDDLFKPELESFGRGLFQLAESITGNGNLRLPETVQFDGSDDLATGLNKAIQEQREGTGTKRAIVRLSRDAK